MDAYAHKILVRVFLDERRLRWAKVHLVDEVPDAPAAAGPDIEDRAVLRAALAKLPPGQRAAVVLRFLADRSVEETAEILNCTSGVLKVEAFMRDECPAQRPAAKADRAGRSKHVTDQDLRRVLVDVVPPLTPRLTGSGSWGTGYGDSGCVSSASLPLPA